MTKKISVNTMPKAGSEEKVLTVDGKIINNEEKDLDVQVANQKSKIRLNVQLDIARKCFLNRDVMMDGIEVKDSNIKLGELDGDNRSD